MQQRGHHQHDGKWQAALEERVQILEAQVAILDEALRVLTRGLEDLPAAEPGRKQAAEAARRAHDLLLTAGPRPAQSAGA
jgi:hypothetical protein